MSQPLTVGLRHRETITVDASLTVPAVSPHFTGFANMPPVFATAQMVGFVEWACVELLKPYLAPAQRTVGIHVNVSHKAATPIGMKVTAEVELVKIEGKKLTFKVTCRDEAEIIGEGEHERYIIEMDKFMSRTVQKVARG